MKPIRRHLVYILPLLLLGFAYIYYPEYGYQDPSFEGDQLVHAARIKLYQDPTLFPTDWMFRSRLPMYTTSFYPTMAWIATSVGSLKATYFFSSILMNLLYLLGMYFLIYEISNDPRAAALVALSTVFFRESFGGTAWFLPDGAHLYPRHVVKNLAPGLWYCFFRFRRQRALAFLFFSLGLLGTFHPLEASHLMVLFSATHVVTGRRDLRSHIKTLMYCVGAFGIGISPYLLSGAPALRPILSGEIPPPVEILKLKEFRMFVPSFETFRLVGFHLMIPSLLALPGFFKLLRDSSFRYREGLMIALGSILVFGFLGNLLVQLNVNLLRLQPLRAFYSFYIILFCYVGVALKEILDEKKWKFLVLYVFLLLIPPRPLVEMIREWKREGRPVYAYQRFAGTYQKDPDFLHLVAWAKANTRKEDLFLAPMEMEEFRIYAERGVILSQMDRGGARMSREYALEWWKRYWDSKEAYERGETELLLEVAARYGASYVVTEGRMLLGLPLAFKNDGFNVYRLPSARE